MGMRTVRWPRRRAIAVAAAALLLATLTGCAPSPTSRPTPTPTPHPTPIFSSDKEALAAATKAYAAYLKVSDEIAHDGGARPERIKDFVTPEQYASQTKDFESFRAKGYFADGSTTFDSARLQHRSTGRSSAVEIGIYVCLDVSAVRLTNSSGDNVTPTGRPERLPLEVVLVTAQRDANRLLVDESKLWSGKNFC